MTQHVLPRHEDAIEHQDGVILVETRAERGIEGSCCLGRLIFIRVPADQLDSRCIHRREEHDGPALVALSDAGMVTEEGIVRERR